MRKFNNEQYALFEQICQMTQEGLRNALYRILKKKYKIVTKNKHFVYAVGDIPIALCAHMDTVFAQPPNKIYYDRNKNVIWSPEGLGADDRAGIFAILSIINSGLKPHIIFTTDEEIGCIGAGYLAKLPCPFPKLNYIIQLDRRGNDDCVFYDCNNRDFVNYVEQFGFVENYGSFSDIYDLCPSWGVAGANLSVGYLNEHSVIETLHVDCLLNTIEKVKKMLSVPIDKIPYFKFIWGHRYYNSAYAFPLEDDEDEDDIGGFQCQCHNCGQNYDSNDCLPVIGTEGNHYFLCLDCLTKVNNIQFCEHCGNAFEATDLAQEYCYECQRLEKRGLINANIL